MNYQFPVLDLFSGIGGFSLGLERTGGFKTVAFCEIEKFPRAVLKKHWPKVPIFGDIRGLSIEDFHTYGVEPPRVLCGGFPCQDISTAGAGRGLSGARSGLWYEYHRLIEEIRPSWAVIENVSALRGRGLDAVLGSLAEIGYDAEWDCIPASAIGAPHQRDRIWIVAYPNCVRKLQPQRREQEQRRRLSYCGSQISDSAGPGQQIVQRECAETGSSRRTLFGANSWWHAEPDVGRVANGVPRRVDRVKSLGNAVVPQIPELIGNAILEWELMC